jgi:2-polyprenyl-3-methyl-5-hydroxy-6-metoxy-1,4-benzoquinol methylase
MLDVDGQVISADALVQRIEQLLEAVQAGDGSVGAPGTAGASGAGGPPGAAGGAAAPVGTNRVVPDPLDAPIHSMRVIHRDLHPPVLEGAGGVRGKVSSTTKKVVRKLTAWYVEPRWILQEQLDSQVIEFSARAFNNVYRLDRELDELRRQNARLRMQLVAANERTSQVRRTVGSLAAEVEGQREIVGQMAMQADVVSLGKEITSVLDRLGAIGTTGADIDYVGFEDRFRGSKDALRASQERYLTLFPPASSPGLIVDIGCGRGEMLSLLEEAGHEVFGVDTDADMVASCKSRGLPAVQDDGIHFLSQTDDGTLKGIFCAQVVEHLITPELERLIVLSQQKLKRGGVLVVETINPRSSYALGNHFYADTSHVRPVHPETLRYICEQVGFTSVELEERSPHPLLEVSGELPDGAVGTAVGALLESVFGHQDYIIVATK